MYRRPGSPLLPALAAATVLASAALLIPAQAAAQAPADPSMPGLPPADAFDIRYWLTDGKGGRVRPMDTQDFSYFVNKARCQCGIPIETQVKLKVTQGKTYSQSEQLITYIGPTCAMAEVTPFGQFKPCVQSAFGTVPTYIPGYNTKFHPLWLASGVIADSERAISHPDTTAAFSCEDELFGQSGVWMCAPNSNKMGGCQSDDFFITGNINSNLKNSDGIGYDFQPPTTLVESVTAEPGDSAVVVSWELGQPGDVFGFRVLCEEAATGKPPPGKGMTIPPLDARSFGTYYYTKDNLCPDGPFSSVNVAPDADANTSATTTDTSADTDIGTGGLDTGGLDTGGLDTDTDTDTGDVTPPRCGDGQTDVDTEACDDGNLVDHDDCRNDCTLPTCGDGVRSVGTTVMEACDLGVNNGPTSLCLAGCVLAPIPMCGDLQVQVGEGCDVNDPPNFCVECSLATCGNGNLDAGEACDDDTDACSPRCTNAQCGDGLLSPGEACDNGANNSDAAACTSTCDANTCGDGKVRSDETDPTLVEECDDGPDNGDDKACLPTCVRNACGDGNLGPDEQCDDGPDNGDDKACLTTCVENTCGDGKLGPGEACDNGADNGDDKLCRSDCTRQSSVGMEKLDWAYVCTPHLSQQTRSARIEGLENDKKYNFLLVSYDRAGNPKAVTTVVNSTPLDTRDLWEQCKAQGDVCGESGFCNVAGRSDNLLALGGLLGLGLGLGGLLRRSRRKRA